MRSKFLSNHVENNAELTMSQRKNLYAVILVLAGFFSPAALADAGQFYLAPGLQWMNFDDGTGFNNDLGYYFGFGYDLTDRISAELSTFDLDPESEAAGGREMDIDHYKLDLIYNLDLQLGMFDTFVVGGVGSSDLRMEEDSLWDIGGGIKYQINDNWTWRTAIRSYQYFNRDHEDNDWGIDTSFVYRFGGNNSRPASSPAPAPASRPAAAAAPERAPAPAPATSPDADRDGVPDSRDNCPDTPRNYAVDEDGCPIPVEEIARVELMVNFDFDRSEVKPEYYSEIEEVADFMEQYPDVVIELEGHTDSRGTEEYNRGLSDRRAAAVRQVMIDRFNVQGSRVSSRGFGEAQPVATNDTDAGRAQNRRVMTVIIKTLQNYRPR